MLKKFTSRKFIITVLTIVVGVATALTETGGKVGAVFGIIAAVAAALVYIIVEGNIAAKAVQLVTKAADKIIDYFDDDTETATDTATETENDNKENEAEAV